MVGRPRDDASRLKRAGAYELSIEYMHISWYGRYRRLGFVIDCVGHEHSSFERDFV
jgi:hypothetical protein